MYRRRNWWCEVQRTKITCFPNRWNRIAKDVVSSNEWHSFRLVKICKKVQMNYKNQLQWHEMLQPSNTLHRDVNSVTNYCISQSFSKHDTTLAFMLLLYVPKLASVLGLNCWRFSITSLQWRWSVRNYEEICLSAQTLLQWCHHLPSALCDPDKTIGLH
jgi:hypothetical protein